MAITLPIVNPVKPLSALAGASNGRVPADRLVPTPGQAEGVPILLVSPAHRAWRALQAAALSAGHVLKTSWASNSYRPYEDQERIFRQRYRTAYRAGTDVKVWNGVRWYRWYGATAAVPGTSNHGWGRAIDLGEERDGDAGAEPLDDGTVRWLVDNELRFGWSHELQSEPWHIRYFEGDQLPQAVLDYERSAGPPVELEADVIYHIEGSPYTFLHLGGRDFLPLTEETFWDLAGQRVKVVTVTNEFFQSASPVGGQGSLLHGKAYGR